jgi:sec-independent protein translocase protein TatA
MSSNFLFVILAISIEHVVLIFLAIVLLFGGKKIPELMRGLGKGIREFNDAKENVKREIESSVNEQPKRDNSFNSNSTTTTTPTT